MGNNIAKTNPQMTKNLPKMFFFTNRKRVENIFDVVANLPKNSGIIIREYDLKYSDRLEFAQKISALAFKNGQMVLVGKDIGLAKEIGADGIHFSDFDDDIFLERTPHRRRPTLRGAPNSSSKKSFLPKMILSYSCHHPKSLSKAKKLKADLVFFSPIFSTKSHPNKKPVGVFALRNFVKKTNIPVFALGGIDKKNVKLLAGSNICGIGGISIFQK
jgi:thiamine-phosphate pyrophosphorylase